jgi:hypothetical protein
MAGFRVTFNQTTPTLTIKTTGVATTLGSLTDIDTTTPEAQQAGATLVYDTNTQTYKAEKVFEYDGEQVTLKGGSF